MPKKDEGIKDAETEKREVQKPEVKEEPKKYTPAEIVELTRGKLLHSVVEIGSTFQQENYMLKADDKEEIKTVAGFIPIFFPEYFGINAPKIYSEEEAQEAFNAGYDKGFEEGKQKGTQEAFQQQYQPQQTQGTFPPGKTY